MKRRHLLWAAVALGLTACDHLPPMSAAPIPIVFVHGNGDTAALWLTTLWRFESNGWPADRLYALEMPNPSSRDDDTVTQAGRSSTQEQAAFLAAEVDRVLARTGASQVALVANSRGGYAVRNYIQNFGGAAKVAKAVLGGVPNHGVWANLAFRPNNEFNGAGPFLTALNAAKGAGGDEATPGVQWLTLRSDHNDKYAQPDGVWIGQRGTPTHVTVEGPALKGANNTVLPGRDHREVSFHEQAFAKTFAFIAGREPATTAIVAQEQPVLDGTVSGLGVAGPNNLPMQGAQLEVFEIDASTGERLGPAVHRKTVGADGRWGPLQAKAQVRYEFVLNAPGYATTHLYRSPFPRSSSVINLRAERLADADRDAKALVVFTRPRGYFGVGRDNMVFDGQSPPPGVPAGVPGVSSSKLKLASAEARTVSAEFNGERLVGRTWPLAEQHLTVLELHH